MTDTQDIDVTFDNKGTCTCVRWVVSGSTDYLMNFVWMHSVF